MTKFIPEIFFIAVIAVYSLVVTKYIPKKYYSFSNLVIATGAICYGLIIGLSREELGLTMALLQKGIVVGVCLSLPLLIVILLLASHKKLRAHFSETPKKNYNLRAFSYELFFRIPFGTALSEEIIFRSVLLAILLTNHAQSVTIVAASILFGLWHIFPTLHTVKNHDPLIEMMDDTRKRNLVAVLGSVIATTIAGGIFSYIALKTSSFITSWFVHATINGFATLGGYLSLWYDNHQKRLKLS